MAKRQLTNIAKEPRTLSIGGTGELVDFAPGESKSVDVPAGFHVRHIDWCQDDKDPVPAAQVTT